MLPGVNELILTIVIVILLFGATKVPKAVKYTGKTMHEYKKGKNEGEDGLRQIEHRIKVIEKRNARENESDTLSSLNLHLNNTMRKIAKKEYALTVSGLLMAAAGGLLIIKSQFLGEITIGVAILLGASGIALIAIGRKIG